MPISVRSRNLVLVALVAGGAAIAAIVLVGQSTSATADNPSVALERFSVLEPADDGEFENLPIAAKMALRSAQTMPETRGALSAIGTTQVGGSQVVVAAIGGSVCAFFVADGAQTCGNADMVEAGEVFAAYPKGCDAYTVIGVVPDGVSELSVDSGNDGKVDATVAVESNVYQAEFDPVRTRLSSEDGSAEVDLPLDSYAAMNEGCK